jgi:hypothetical protein
VSITILTQSPDAQGNRNNSDERIRSMKPQIHRKGLVDLETVVSALSNLGQFGVASGCMPFHRPGCCMKRPACSPKQEIEETDE